jgi:MSHA biogenesis protein MshQ
VRIRYPVAAPTVTACSTDNFSVRPPSITVTSTDATNLNTSGTPTIKTGANFNLTAASGVAGYTGTPTIDNTKVLGSPNAGMIGGSFGAAAALTGTATGNSFFYSEVGHFGLSTNAVFDSTFTAVDQPGDCTAGFSNAPDGIGRYGCSFGSAELLMAPGSTGFGRFIPDNFNVTYNAPSFTTACAAGAFTYVGQTIPYAIPPQLTVTARSGTANGLTNTTTRNYAGPYMKLSNVLGSSLNQAPYDTQGGRYARFDALGGGTTPALDTALLPLTTADPTIGVFTDGEGSLTFASGLALVRSTTTPSAPFDADIALSLDIIDIDGVAFAGNPARFGSAAAGNGIAFSNIKAMRFGRMRLGNPVGSEKLDLPVPLTTEYWTGFAFATNTLDSCTALTAQNFVLSNHQGGLTTTNMVSPTGGASPSPGNVSISGTFTMGVANLKLLKPSSATAPGSVDVCADLDIAAATGDTSCEAPVPADKPWLRLVRSTPPGTHTQDPVGRAAFGLYGGQPKNFIYFRENY